jgi:hypothetical protein
MTRKKTIEAFSPEFGWTTEQGSFVGRAHTVYRNGTAIEMWIYVYRVREGDGAHTHLCLWESREVGKPDGNELAEFDAWRMHATGYVPDPWMRAQVSYQREDARWQATQ